MYCFSDAGIEKFEPSEYDVPVSTILPPSGKSSKARAIVRTLSDALSPLFWSFPDVLTYTLFSLAKANIASTTHKIDSRIADTTIIVFFIVDPPQNKSLIMRIAVLFCIYKNALLVSKILYHNI